MKRNARRARLVLAAVATLGGVTCAGSRPPRLPPSTATAFPPACEAAPPDPVRDARIKTCAARDDVRRYAEDLKRAILSGWAPPPADDDASVLLRFQVAPDGTPYGVCALDDFDSPLAPSALEAVERVKGLPHPDPAVVACLPDMRPEALFKIKVETR